MARRRNQVVKERVSVVHGKIPILLIAPHGYDDSYTDIMTEHAALSCQGNAVINRGWQRAPSVDIFNDKANCNSWNHCQHDVVKDEFYDPIVNMKHSLVQKHSHLYVFHIHGCGNHIRQQVGFNVDVIIGYGAGKPAVGSCYGKYREPICWLGEG